MTTRHTAPRYRHRLPQLAGGLFLTDGGIETTMIYHERLDLPCFATFPLLSDDRGRQALTRYYERYLAVAMSIGAGFVLESATWRASQDWADRIGYSAEALDEANRQSITLLQALRDTHDAYGAPIVISGCVGPRGDGYDPGALMSPEEAEAYHARQIAGFAASLADMVTGITITNAAEAMGITRAARAAGLPVAISFTLETDGRLPTGQPLGDAIAQVDAAPGGAPAYYMINCAHPSHFEGALQGGSPWTSRIRGIRANASSLSHAELDRATELDAGDPEALARQYRALRQSLPNLNVLGGCCGTDHRHIARIAHLATAA
jgi:S-methylmethionine-dependent homocysteine/selenocysteine methylase